MKRLPLLTHVPFAHHHRGELLSAVSAALCLPAQKSLLALTRTLSASTKKQPPGAGLFSFWLRPLASPIIFYLRIMSTILALTYSSNRALQSPG